MRRSRVLLTLKTSMTMIRITGYREIDEAIRHLPDAVQDSIVGAANMKAAKPLVEKEKQLAPVGATHNLVESIGAIRKGKRGNIIGEVWVAPRRRRPYKGFAGHLNEFGTVVRRTRKGANRGAMPIQRFAKPAWTATKDAVERAIRSELGKSVIRTMKRYLR